jgi:hypothetical protein
MMVYLGTGWDCLGKSYLLINIIGNKSLICHGRKKENEIKYRR